MRTTVVVPTYNERENIVPLLHAIEALHVSDLSVLIVDDNSPDGTSEAVREYALTHPTVELLHRPGKSGLGPAYNAGFLQVFQRQPMPDVVLQMDADFSHDPRDIPRLLAETERADLVIGSRYVRGGGVSNWSLRRRMLSRGGNLYARLLTRVPVHDLTGGFLAWRADVLRALDPARVTAEGYGYLIALKVRAIRHGARVREIPIIFTERRAGASKMSAHVVREGALLAAKLGRHGKE